MALFPSGARVGHGLSITCARKFAAGCNSTLRLPGSHAILNRSAAMPNVRNCTDATSLNIKRFRSSQA
jgi:hypothetical protein